MITHRLADPDSAFLYAMTAVCAMAPSISLQHQIYNLYVNHVQSRELDQQISHELGELYLADILRYMNF